MALSLESLKYLVKKYFSDIKDLPIPIHIITIMYGDEKVSISLLENNIEACIQSWTLPKIKSVLDKLDYH